MNRPSRTKFDVAFAAALRLTERAPIDLYEETIEAERFPGDEQSRIVRGYLKDKYADRKIDVIVAVGTAALSYARQYRPIFGNPPIVAIATETGQIGVRNDDVTGLQGRFNGATIELALALLPDTQRVFVVNGTRGDDPVDVEAEIESEWKERSGSVAVVYLKNLPLSDLVTRVAAIPAHSVVLFRKQTMRDWSRDLDQLEGLSEVVRVSPVPIFGVGEQYLGRGIVGGVIWRFEADARRLAEMAIVIANGTTTRDIPPEPSNHALMFDWRQLQRWNIPESRLPAGSVVLGRPQSFFEVYRRYVVGGLAIFAAQSALIAGLLLQRVRRRRAEAQTRTSEARSSAILRAIPDLMFVLRRDGTFLDYHARDPGLLFAPPDQFLGRTIKDVLPPAVADLLMTSVERACRTGDPVLVEYELGVSAPRCFEARLVYAEHDRVLSIVRDVTESKRAVDLNRHLAGRLIASQEAERQRIARELHDDLSQKIALLNIDIDQIAAGEVGEHRSRLQTLLLRAGEIATDVHNLSHELHPARLQTLGLAAALQALCREVSQHRGVRVAFSHDIVSQVVDPSVSLCLYRITQEALHNVARHSQARDASVHLTRDHDDLILVIGDSGIGFEMGDGQTGLGLVSMRERVALLKGQLTIHTSPGSGTHVDVRVPLNPSIRESSLLLPNSA